MIKEQWKQLPDYDYQISNMGNLRRLSTLKPIGMYKDSKKGYWGTELWRDGKRVHKKMHQLVMWGFKGLPEKGYIVCHNDGNPDNNHLSNLRYDTQKSNHADKYKHGTEQTGENSPNHKLTNTDVERIRFLHKKGGFNGVELADIFEVEPCTIARIVKRQSWKHI